MNGVTAAQSSRDSGFALLVVLSFLLMATALTTPFVTGAHVQALVTRNSSQSAREEILLRGLVEMAATRYIELYENPDAQSVTDVICPAPHAGLPDIAFHFQDHRGLIDLNAASQDVLAIGFEALSMKHDDAEKLASEAVRFRSADSGQNSAPNGAVPLGGYKHGLFETTAELTDLYAFPRVQADAVNRVFSVHSGTGTVDRTAAQGELLERLAQLKENESYFVVNDARRGTAFSVTVSLAVNGRWQASGGAVLAPSENPMAPRWLEPFVFERGNTKGSHAANPGAIACGDYFDPVLLDVLTKAMS